MMEEGLAKEAGPAARVPLLPVAESRRLGRAAGVPSSMTHLNAFRALLAHPELAGAVANLLATLLYKANRLDLRLRELLILRIAWRTGSVYEWTQHWRVATQCGIPAADLLAVRDWRQAPNFTAADRAILAATDETLDHGRISDATWAACGRHLGSDAERIELVLAIANWRLFSEMFRSLDIPLEDGVAPWPPDGVAPPGE